MPTVAESGLPGFDVDLWIGIYAPRGMPQPVLGAIERGAEQGAGASRHEGGDGQDRVEPRGTTVEEATAFTQTEFEKWKKVIVEGKIKPE